jgi:FKBP-type peptidyl-prolyl cis-trans isomerase FkpA
VQRFGLAGCHSKQSTSILSKTYMKKILLLLSLSVTVISFQGCIKSAVSGPCTDQTPASELAVMQAYASTNGYSMTTHPSGMLYQVVNAGTGAIPLPTSKVFVKYTGRLVSSNAIFDQQTNPSLTGFTVSQLIPAWQLGMELIAKGGTIRLIVPSSLAYGCSGYGAIPGNAVLFFEIELVDVQ